MWLVVTKVRSESFGLVTERRHYNARPIYASLSYVLFFIVECGIACFPCAVCVLCTYLTFGHHPHPLGYPSAKFRFCCHLHCWASLHRKIAYSITHSFNQSPSLLDVPGTEAFASEKARNLSWTIQSQVSVTSWNRGRQPVLLDSKCNCKNWPSSFPIRPLLISESVKLVTVATTSVLRPGNAHVRPARACSSMRSARMMHAFPS